MILWRQNLKDDRIKRSGPPRQLMADFYNFCGVGVDTLTFEEAFARIDEWLTQPSGRSHHVACLNAFCVALSISNPRLRRIYNGADIAAPDGAPFVRWMRLATGRRCDRLDGPQLILNLARRSDRSYRFFIYGGEPKVLADAARSLATACPGIEVVGSYSPPFRELSQEEDRQAIAMINAAKPDIVIVALGTPKQDYWIDAHLESIRGAVLIAAGAAVDFFGGRVPLAPDWIRNSGFEWLFRLLGPDFLRLWRRYLVHHAVFVGHFLLQVVGLRTIPAERWTRP